MKINKNNFGKRVTNKVDLMNSKERSNSKGPVKEYLTWDTYTSYITLLANKIIESGITFTHIYGIQRGGLIPAVILSHKLNIPISTLYPVGMNNNCLVVDDIIDSGETYNIIKKVFKIHKLEYKYATIFKHKKSDIIPDFYIKENKKWIMFPYENDME